MLGTVLDLRWVSQKHQLKSHVIDTNAGSSGLFAPFGALLPNPDSQHEAQALAMVLWPCVSACFCVCAVLLQISSAGLKAVFVIAPQGLHVIQLACMVHGVVADNVHGRGGIADIAPGQGAFFKHLFICQPFH